MELREFRAELPSTQTEAIRRAREGAPEGTRVVAGRQSAGRGRSDHAWSSPEGNLYLSVILRAPDENRALLPLAVGARLRRALDRRYHVPTVLKWPNDLLVLGGATPRKLAGILVDVLPSPSLGAAAVVGIGLNVGAPLEAYPPEVRGRIVGLSELSSPLPTLIEVEEEVASAAESALAAVATLEGTLAILVECRSALHGVGRPATVDRAMRGIIRTLGDEGELWLDTPSGAVAIRSGDVVVEEA